MYQRQAERHLARPGVTVEFRRRTHTTLESKTLNRISTSRVRDLSVLDCAFDVPADRQLRKGDRGTLHVSIPAQSPAVTSDVTVARVWETGAAVQFDKPQHMEPYFGQLAPDAFAGQRVFDRKMKSALMDVVQLSTEAGRLRSSATRLMLTGLVVALAFLSQLLLARGAGLFSPATRLLAELMPAITLALFGGYALKRIMALNQVTSYLSLLRRQIGKGSFLKNYEGWDRDLERLHNADTVTIPDTTRHPWSAQILGNLPVNAMLAVGGCVALYMVSTAMASSSVAEMLPITPMEAQATAMAGTVGSIVVPAVLLWQAVQTIFGRHSAQGCLKAWEDTLGQEHNAD